MNWSRPERNCTRCLSVRVSRVWIGLYEPLVDTFAENKLLSGKQYRRRYTCIFACTSVRHRFGRGLIGRKREGIENGFTRKYIITLHRTRMRFNCCPLECGSTSKNCSRIAFHTVLFDAFGKHSTRVWRDVSLGVRTVNRGCRTDEIIPRHLRAFG